MAKFEWQKAAENMAFDYNQALSAIQLEVSKRTANLDSEERQEWKERTLGTFDYLKELLSGMKDSAVSCDYSQAIKYLMQSDYVMNKSAKIISEIPADDFYHDEENLYFIENMISRATHSTAEYLALLWQEECHCKRKGEGSKLAAAENSVVGDDTAPDSLAPHNDFNIKTGRAGGGAPP